jgi:hypothetical protein
MKEGPKVELIAYQDMIYQNVERVKEHLRKQWLNGLHEIYKTCSKKKQLPSEQKLPTFLRALSVQMTNHIQSMTLESMQDFHKFIVHLNDEKVEKQRAGFALSLKIVNGKIAFYPGFQDVENALLDTFDTIIKASRDIPR